MDECVFCEISKKKLPAEIIYEDDLIMCIMDCDPVNDGHVLLITRAHRLDIDELTDEESNRIMKVSKIIYKVLKETYDFDGYTIMQNGGMFNDVGHYHMHFFPRYKNDGFKWIWPDIKPKNIAEEGKILRTKIDKILEDIR